MLHTIRVRLLLSTLLVFVVAGCSGSNGVDTTPQILFESNWDTALGSSGNAINDGGKWDTGYCSGDLLTVVANDATLNVPGGYNALRTENDTPYCRLLGKLDFQAEGEDFYLRVYFRNDDENDSGVYDHSLEHNSTANGQLMYKGHAGHPDGTFSMRSTLGIYGYPLYGWTLGNPDWMPGDPVADKYTDLDNETWYRLEYYVQFQSPGAQTPARFRFYPRVYSHPDGVLLFDYSTFLQHDYRSTGVTYQGRNDWTLKKLYEEEDDYWFTHDLGSNMMNDLSLGTNGQAGQQTTNMYWYFAAVKIRGDNWVGPITR